jgi:dolichol-phosphate mannosyltransferase
MDVDEIVQTNFLGTINLVEAALETGFEAFVNVGSSSEYGPKDHAPCENEIIEPNSHYAVGKAAATLYCRFVANSRQMHIPTMRLYSVYGPYEDRNRLIPALILNGLHGKWPPLVNPNIARDYIYSEDVNDAFIRTASTRSTDLGAVYNVGTGVQTTLREAVAVAQRVLHITAEPRWNTMPNRQWDTDVWVADNSKIQHELGWRPTYTFEQGFRAAADWFRENPAVYQVDSAPG